MLYCIYQSKQERIKKMTRKQLTKSQLIKLAVKLQQKMQINNISNDGEFVILTGKANGKEIAIFWEIIDGIHEMYKIMIEQGDTIFTIA